MKINSWAFVFGGDPYTPPEYQEQRLVGLVEGHASRPDGTDIITSAIVGKCEGAVITQSGSRYELGDPDPTYEAMYPNARERLMETLPELEHLRCH